MSQVYQWPILLTNKWYSIQLKIGSSEIWVSISHRGLIFFFVTNEFNIFPHTTYSLDRIVPSISIDFAKHNLPVINDCHYY